MKSDENHPSWIKRAREVIDIEINGLIRVKNELDGGFCEATELILETLAKGGKIVATGVGKNLHIAEKISATLASTGSTSVVLNPTQAMHGDLGIISKNDVVLAFSYSGESEELITLLTPIKRITPQIIAVTGNDNSSLATFSTVVIKAAVDKEACPFNLAPTSSTTATMAVGDALAMVLLEAKGFMKEDYAKLHPAGAIGRSLLMTVKDIMRSEDRIASVNESSSVRDVLLAMTKARSGSAAVTDSKERVIGIFTDGDLRRHISGDTDILNHSISEYMSEEPITVTPDQLAVEVLHIFEKHSIDDLLVVDKKGRLAGAVDIQDLPKLKVM